ncbi:MAG: protein translocase subunit SecF [Deltaproteobacteria bacterium]|nr:protein translocase subunit SecF [Deltaproteobacteria bacterium]
MEIIKPGTRIPFLDYRRWGFMLSSVLIIGVVLLLFTKGPNLGVDFEGGTMVHVKLPEAVTIGQLRDALQQSPLGGVVQDFGGGGTNEYLIRMEKSETEIGTVGRDVRAVLDRSFGAGKYEVLRVESVGPKVGDDLRRRGILSVIFATIMMGAYIWIRFELRFGLGAIVALIHDVLITVGALVVAGFEFDLPIVAALLTIAGYSVNDTVVICDRIRENMRKKRRDSMENIINTSINETLGRTILTTITSLLVLTALLILGGGVIRPFAYTLFVGFLAGLYSTVFVATPIILLLERSRRR